jgi:hypothetical protein
VFAAFGCKDYAKSRLFAEGYVMESQTPDLELEIDERFQRTEWRLQRLGWAAWALLILAGTAGLLGSGYLSETTSTASDGTLTIVYERFLHYHHPTQLEAVFTLPVNDAEDIRLKISQSLLDRMQIERIEPEPAGAVLAEDGVVYTFKRSATVDGKVLFFVDFERFGKSSGQIQIVGHEPAALNQFVYP